MKLGGILSVVGAVVGIAAAVASGGTLAWLAAGMLTLNAATSVGLVGGSVGKFMESGAGRALTLAAGAAAAYGAFAPGASAGDVGTAESAQSANAASQTASTVSQSAADSAAAGGSEVAQGAAAAPSSVASSANDMINPPNVAGSAAGAGTNQAAWNMSGPPLNSASGVNGASMAQVSATENSATNAAVLPNSTPNTLASQTGQQALVPEANAPGGGSNFTGGQAQPQQEVASSANAPMSGSPGVDPQTGIPTTSQPGGGTVAPAAPQTNFNPGETSGGGGTPQSGGIFNTMFNTKGGAGLMQGAAGSIGGIGQGMMQKQAMEDQIKAMQWANMQWENQSQVGQVNNAAAAPINVPGGYLQRAQAIRSMVSTNPFVPPAPTPVPGAPPPARPA